VKIGADAVGVDFNRDTRLDAFAHRREPVLATAGCRQAKIGVPTGRDALGHDRRELVIGRLDPHERIGVAALDHRGRSRIGRGDLDRLGLGVRV